MEDVAVTKSILEQIAGDYAGRLDVRKVVVDRNDELVQKYFVRAMPTLMLFGNGQALGSIVGLRSRTQLVEMLDRIA